MVPRDIDFGFVASPAGEPGLSDRELYQEILVDCALGQALGYSTAWMIEHHFSDYFPTPNPLAFLSHLAARFPKLALGTCVLVTPWYQPLRLAEEIAQLNLLTEQPLHLGLGRGTAKLEYDAFGIDMDESRDRFEDVWRIVERALKGGRFTYQGKVLQTPKEVELRPRGDTGKIHFYGAIGASPESAHVMADLGMPPMQTSIGNLEKQKETIAAWKERAEASGLDTRGFRYPIMINCIVADTDDDAVRQAQAFIPRFQQAQVDHYEGDKDHFTYLKTYKAWQNVFRSMKERADPANIPPWCEWQLVGSPSSVIRKTRAYVEAGFDTFLLHVATPGVPRERRHTWLSRFAREVAPEFSSSFAARAVRVA
jgi:alkanesulfonate monooxygenase SsuD/methylene tetrahydromethanopterin reductase-like flavin-dependent oxidoreductase (luciferase family)